VGKRQPTELEIDQVSYRRSIERGKLHEERWVGEKLKCADSFTYTETTKDFENKCDQNCSE